MTCHPVFLPLAFTQRPGELRIQVGLACYSVRAPRLPRLQLLPICCGANSGTLPEESSFFTSAGHPFPAICIRTSTERPEAIDKDDFIIAGIDEKSLLQAVDTAVELNRDGQYGILVSDYVDENVSTKVVKIIQSYTGIVNKMVWRKFYRDKVD